MGSEHSIRLPNGLTQEEAARYINACQKGLRVLQPRIQRLREQAARLERGYVRLFTMKRRLEEQTTTVTKLPTIKPGEKTPHLKRQQSPQELVSSMSTEQKAELRKLLGG